MIYIDSKYAKYYNHLIHSFLEALYFEGFGEEERIDSLDNFFPGYLIRDNTAQCLAVADDLYYWSQDDFLHKLDSMHQLALYNFLEFVAEYQQDMGEAVAVFYQGEESQRFIDDLWESLDRDDIFNKKISKREFTNYVQDVYTMIDECFEDIDFITFPYLLGAYGRHNVENSQAIKSLIDSYGSLLPKDILDDYRREIGFLQPDASGGELFSEVITLIKKVGCLITHGEVNSLVSTYSERDIHRVLRAMFDIALSHRQDIYLTHEFLAAGASIDFVFSRGGEAVPVEVKLASNGRLKHGIERQLVRYAGIIGVDRAIMIVVCQSESDIRKIDRLRENLGVTSHVAIELVAIDARRKYPASRLN